MRKSFARKTSNDNEQNLDIPFDEDVELCSAIQRKKDRITVLEAESKVLDKHDPDDIARSRAIDSETQLGAREQRSRRAWNAAHKLFDY